MLDTFILTTQAAYEHNPITEYFLIHCVTETWTFYLHMLTIQLIIANDIAPTSHSNYQVKIYTKLLRS